MEYPNPNLEPIDLLERENASLYVCLWWVKENMKTYIEVLDVTENQHFILDVPPENAHEAFHHPFYYQQIAFNALKHATINM